MKLKVFNSTLNEVKNKKFNIFIGISVGVKPLNEKIAKEYISWALNHTENKILILIADEIAKYNYQVFSSYNETKSLKRAYKDGEEHRLIFEKTIEKHFQKEKEKIEIISWETIVSAKYQESKKIITAFFEENKEFQEKINYFLKKYTERRSKDLSEEKLKKLSHYILSELPTILSGIDHENTHYNLLFYPTYIHSGLSELCVNIFQKKEYPELNTCLKLKNKTILVEAYIEE